MTEFIRLNYLVGFSVATGHYPNRILYCDTLTMSQRHLHEKHTSFLLTEIFLLFWKPSCAANSQVRARWMSNNQVPLSHLCVCVSAVVNVQFPLSNGRTSPLMCHSGCPPLHSCISQENALWPFARNALHTSCDSSQATNTFMSAHPSESDKS